jgi:hypothetical protein
MVPSARGSLEHPAKTMAAMGSIWNKRFMAIGFLVFIEQNSNSMPKKALYKRKVFSSFGQNKEKQPI